MPPRDSELPEGTDHIITGAMERTVEPSGGGGSGGTIGSGEADDTGGSVTGGDGSSSFTAPLRQGVASLKSQATERAWQFADDGKARASDTLEELSRIVEEAAGSIDERLGEQYGPYARRASDALSSFAATLRDREVDELYEDVRGFVRKSPVIAIGAAAAIGFTLVRLVKAGVAAEQPEEEGAGEKPARKPRRRTRTETEG